MKVTLFRRDKLLEASITLGPKPNDTAYLARIENPSEAQKAAYKNWLGAAWDENEVRP